MQNLLLIWIVLSKNSQNTRYTKYTSLVTFNFFNCHKAFLYLQFLQFCIRYHISGFFFVHITRHFLWHSMTNSMNSHSTMVIFQHWDSEKIQLLKFSMIKSDLCHYGNFPTSDFGDFQHAQIFHVKKNKKSTHSSSKTGNIFMRLFS